VRISIDGKKKAEFRKDLLAHRAAFALGDADYARDKLKVSLNTFKKCIADESHQPLVLTRHTFATICAGANLNPTDYGFDFSMPTVGVAFGGYGKADFAFLIGRFALHRRSFLTGRNVNRSALDIAWSERNACLSFVEHVRYDSDKGVQQAFEYSGNIYMHRERMLLSLLGIQDGEVRLTLVHAPDRPSPGRKRPPHKLRGALLTHAYPKGFFQPTFSPVYIEEAAPGPKSSINAICRTLTPGDSDFERIVLELDDIEEHSAVVTSLLARAQPRAK
jgi:hypothetical protein